MNVRGLAIVLTTLLTACGMHRAYCPQPLTAEREVDARTVRALGDVELAFALRYVGSSDGAPLLTIWLRNASVTPVAIDLGRLRVRGLTANGSRALQLHDPRGEVEPLHLDAGARGHEKIRLADVGVKEGALRQICLDPSPVFTEYVVAHAPVCFAPGSDAEWTVTP